MTELNGVRLPAWYNGIGVHDSPGCYVATMNYSEARAHAEELKDHGITLDKLFVSGGNKVDRARGEVDGGILVAVRDWVDRPWGRNPAQWVMPVDQIRMYADVGVQLFEIAGNEINIACEWVNDAIPQDPAVLAHAAVDAFEVALNACAQVPGTYPLLTSCTPGGNVDHRRVYPATIAELNRRGLMSSVKHCAIHPRPHNNPPETKWTATNTVTFDEWTWIRDHFPTSVYFWATEHGYSLNDDQNRNYPRIDLQKHTDYNWTLDTWMNPDHASAIEPNLAGFCHWFEAGWGHWGAWPKDALIDSIVPEMPAPSPLWVRMGERVTELEFNRYDAPPVVDHARGFDCSAYQGDINWDAVAADFSFVFIRASSGPNADSKYAQNYDGAHEHGLLTGAYHYLTQADSGQAALFYNTVGDRVPELGYYADLEAADLTADKCQLFLEYTDNWTGKVAGIYTRASFFDRFGVPAWTVGRPLWVAHWDAEEPTLPAAWHSWEFWQTGQGPVAGQIMDLDEYNGDEEALFDNYGPEEPPMTEPIIIDITGTQQDWAWLQATYGAVEILPADGYQVTQLTEVEGIMGFTLALQNEAGGPVAGQQVAYVTPTQEYIEITQANGVAEHTAGAGEGYFPPGPGPISWYVIGTESERITGLGWLGNTNHRHLQVTMQWNGGPEPPPPPDDWQADTTARLDRIEQLVLHIHAEHVFQPDHS